jgi:hypothetical protein
VETSAPLLKIHIRPNAEGFKAKRTLPLLLGPNTPAGGVPPSLPGARAGRSRLSIFAEKKDAQSPRSTAWRCTARVVRTSSAVMPGSLSAWPANGTIRSSARPQPCARLQAAVGGQIMS